MVKNKNYQLTLQPHLPRTIVNNGEMLAIHSSKCISIEDEGRTFFSTIYRKFHINDVKKMIGHSIFFSPLNKSGT